MHVFLCMFSMYRNGISSEISFVSHLKVQNYVLSFISIADFRSILFYQIPVQISFLCIYCILFKKSLVFDSYCFTSHFNSHSLTCFLVHSYGSFCEYTSRSTVTELPSTSIFYRLDCFKLAAQFEFPIIVRQRVSVLVCPHQYLILPAFLFLPI